MRKPRSKWARNALIVIGALWLTVFCVSAFGTVFLGLLGSVDQFFQINLTEMEVHVIVEKIITALTIVEVFTAFFTFGLTCLTGIVAAILKTVPAYANAYRYLNVAFRALGLLDALLIPVAVRLVFPRAGIWSSEWTAGWCFAVAGATLFLLRMLYLRRKYPANPRLALKFGIQVLVTLAVAMTTIIVVAYATKDFWIGLLGVVFLGAFMYGSFRLITSRWYRLNYHWARWWLLAILGLLAIAVFLGIVRATGLQNEVEKFVSDVGQFLATFVSLLGARALKGWPVWLAAPNLWQLLWVASLSFGIPSWIATDMGHSSFKGAAFTACIVHAIVSVVWAIACFTVGAWVMFGICAVTAILALIGAVLAKRS